jgi:hypothetical protein
MRVLLLILTITISFNYIYTQCVSGDCVDGYGILKYNNPNSFHKEYKGFFDNGKRSGYGELTLGDKRIVRGYFYNDSCCEGAYESERDKKFVVTNVSKDKQFRYEITSNDFLSFGGLHFFNDINSNYLELANMVLPSPIISKFYSHRKVTNGLTQNASFYNPSGYLKYNDRFLIYVVEREYNSAGSRKYWIEILDIENMNVKSIGSFGSPISTDNNIVLNGVVDNNLCYSYYLNSQKKDIKKSVNLSSFSEIFGEQKDVLFNKLRLKQAEILIERNGDLQYNVYFNDSIGTQLNRVVIDNYDVNVISNDNKFVWIYCAGGGYWSHEKPNSVYHDELRKYSRNGELIQRKIFNSSNGKTKIKFHPYSDRYLVSYRENNKNLISEFSLSNIDSLIQVIYENNWKYIEDKIGYSPTGKYIKIRETIFRGKDKYFVQFGETGFFCDEDKLLLCQNDDYIVGFDIVNRSILWKMEKKNFRINDGNENPIWFNIIYNQNKILLFDDYYIAQIDLQNTRFDIESVSIEKLNIICESLKKNSTNYSNINLTEKEFNSALNKIEKATNDLENGRSPNEVFSNSLTNSNLESRKKYIVEVIFVDNGSIGKCKWCPKNLTCTKLSSDDMKFTEKLYQNGLGRAVVQMDIWLAQFEGRIINNGDGTFTHKFPINLYSCPEFCSLSCKKKFEDYQKYGH